MRRLPLGVLSLVLIGALVACSEDASNNEGPGSSGGGGSSGQAGQAGAGGATAGAAGAAGMDAGGIGGIGGTGGIGGSPQVGEVYAHSQDTLYLLEPVAKALTEIGVFDCISVSDPNDSADGMTDIAIDKSGNMLGVGVPSDNTGSPSHALFTVDPKSGSCSLVATLPTLYQGLSFVPEGTLEANEEVLVAFGADGTYARIDETTGEATTIGPLGAGWSSKGGDMVAIVDDAMFIMASNGGDDHLVTMDPVSGGVLLDIGDTGLSFGGAGLGYWGGRLYAFAYDGKLYEIDVSTAVPTEIPITNGPEQFRGAGVTTVAPIEYPK